MGNSLGRGISSFLPEIDNDVLPVNLPIDSISPNRYQPRRYFDEDAIISLSESIKSKGVIQPLIVRDIGDGKYELIAGERRLRASKLANLQEVPVVVKEMTDSDALEIAILENIQREDLNPIEEAEGYERLIKEFLKTQEEVAKITGKSRSHIANMLRLLTLSDYTKEKLVKGKITAGHAKVLVGVDDEKSLIDKIIEEKLNVRQTEKLIFDIKNPSVDANNQKINTNLLLNEFTENLEKSATEKQVANTKLPRIENDDSSIKIPPKYNSNLNEHENLSNQLSEILQTNVKIHLKGDHGAMLIYFENFSELDRILKQITNSNI